MEENKRERINFGAALQAQGLELKGKNPDGSVRVFDPQAPETEREYNLDVRAALKAEGLDYDKVDLQYNDESSPLDENIVGFGMGVKLAKAKSPENKQRLLEEHYGKENVKMVGDSEFAIKDEDGLWKKGSDSFFSGLASALPEMGAGAAGAIAGAKAGALIGAPIPIPGTTVIGGIIGGVLGGALSGSVAKIATDEVASKLNIRDESDFNEIKTELGKEFVNNALWDVALLGTGKVLKHAGKFGADKIGKMYNRSEMADVFEKMIPGTKKGDWSTVLKSNDNAQQVIKEMDRVVNFTQAKDAGKFGPGAIDPATSKMNLLIRDSMTKAKKIAEADFDKNMSYLDAQGVFSKAQVDVAPIKDSLESALKQSGILSETGARLSTKQAIDLGLEVNIFDARSRNQLSNIYKMIQNKEGVIPATEARKLMKGINNILEDSGFFKSGDLAISSESRRLLAETRGSLREGISKSLNNKFILSTDGSGKILPAAQLYNDTMTRYSKYRNTFDNFSMPSRFGDFSNTENVRRTIDKMIGPQGVDLETSFGQLMELTGQQGAATLNRVQVLRAAKNLSASYAPSQTGATSIVKAELLPGIFSPKGAARTLGKQAKNIENMERSVVIKKMAETNQFLKKLNKDQRLQLFSEPALYRPILRNLMEDPESQGAEMGMP